MFKGTGNHNSCTVSRSALLLLLLRQNELSRARGPLAPSRLVDGGVCLYDAVVVRGDLRQGLGELRPLQLAFLLRENLPAAEERNMRREESSRSASNIITRTIYSQ